MIDLIGYRRFGHNEADEPAYTQPEMYAVIKGKKRVADLYAERLVEQGVISREEVESQQQEIWDELTRLHQDLKAAINVVSVVRRRMLVMIQLALRWMMRVSADVAGARRSAPAP